MPTPWPSVTDLPAAPAAAAVPGRCVPLRPLPMPLPRPHLRPMLHCGGPRRCLRRRLRHRLRLLSGGGSFGYGIQGHVVDNGQIFAVLDSMGGMGFNWFKQQIEWKRFESAGPGQID